MNYTANGGLWQICLIKHNGRFGYVGITDEQRKELLELKKHRYTKPIEELLPESELGKYLQERDARVKILKENYKNDIMVQWNGEKVIGFRLRQVVKCDAGERR